MKYKLSASIEKKEKWKNNYDDCLNKLIEGNRKSFGNDFAMQNQEIYNKAFKKSYLRKEYILPSGKISIIQGFENYILDYLFKLNYKEEDILINKHEINEEVGIIRYIGKDTKEHIYFPDFYIISENKIIEVKSTYYYNKDLENNLLKKEACINNGLNFSFYIYDRQNKNIIIK